MTELKGREAEVRRNSDRAFKDHVITELSRNGVYRSWRCGRPDRSDCAFVITTIPGSIIVTGDIGDLIVSRCYDMLPWCRGSCDSTGYFIEKVPHGCFEVEEFDPERLRAWVEDQIANASDYGIKDDEIETLKESLEFDDYSDNDATHWYRKFRSIWDGDPPDWSSPKHRLLWCRDAIRWFVNHHDEEVIQDPKSKRKDV